MHDPETCDQCGFDGARWSTGDLAHAFSYIPFRAAYTLEGLPGDVPGRRLRADTWSMLEYLDHVRTVVWGHRFIVDIAGQDPGIDLGTPDELPFEAEVAQLDRDAVGDALHEECLAMETTLEVLSPSDWTRSVVIGGRSITVAGAVGHAMHDATHHMHDLGRLRVGFGHGAGPDRGRLAQINVSAGGVPKRAVADSVDIDAGGVVGDVQRNRRHHGRPFQALSLWSRDVIGALRDEGHPIEAGSAGENLTVSGLDWAAIRPGTILSIGPVRCEVTAYASPCAHNNQWFTHRDSQRIRHEQHPGWSRVYASILRPGTVAVDDEVVVEPG